MAWQHHGPKRVCALSPRASLYRSAHKQKLSAPCRQTLRCVGPTVTKSGKPHCQRYMLARLSVSQPRPGRICRPRRVRRVH
jgi:hypothetical protein